MHLGEIGDLGGPIVLLEVDVGGVVAAPRRKDVLVPKALKGGWDAWGAGAADEQVSAELEVEFFEIGVVLGEVGVAPQLDIGGEAADMIGGTAEVELDPVEE